MSVDKINDNAEAATKSDRRHHKTSLRMSTSYREGSGRFNNIFKQGRGILEKELNNHHYTHKSHGQENLLLFVLFLTREIRN